MAFCTHCGNQIAEDARFCTKCGARFGADPNSEQASAQQMTPSFVTSASMGQQMPMQQAMLKAELEYLKQNCFN